MSSANATKPGAKTALQRQQASRQRSGNAYTKARNAAEREVVHVMVQRYSATYDLIRCQVDDEVPEKHRAVRQSRTRSGCAAWFRKTNPKEWSEILDRHIAEVTAGTSVVIRRRKAG